MKLAHYYTDLSRLNKRQIDIAEQAGINYPIEGEQTKYLNELITCEIEYAVARGGIGCTVNIPSDISKYVMERFTVHLKNMGFNVSPLTGNLWTILWK